MAESLEVRAVAPPEDPDETFDRVGSDEEGHEFLIDLYLDRTPEEDSSAEMADRFPSLDDIAAGTSALSFAPPSLAPVRSTQRCGRDS